MIAVRICAAVSAAALLLISAACTTSPAVPTTQPLPTATTLIRPTLPPTWTPTPPPTAAATDPPATATFTRTPPPTLSTAERCANFVTSTNLKGFRSFSWSDQIAFLANASTPEGLRFSVRRRFSGENLNAELPGDSLVGFQLPLKRLPRTGLYDWTLTLLDAENDVCVVSGSFIYRPRTPLPRED